MELCFLFISPCFSFNGQNYVLFTAEPRTHSLLLLCAETLNFPLDLLFPKGISQVEGCESLARSSSTMWSHLPWMWPLAKGTRGPSVEQQLWGPACGRAGSRFKLSLQRRAASSVHKYPALLCWLCRFPYKQTRSHFPSEPSGFDRCPQLFLGPLLEGKKGRGYSELKEIASDGSLQFHGLADELPLFSSICYQHHWL